MLNVILYQPEIHLIRVISFGCVQYRCTVTLVKPLGFLLIQQKLRRAGLDYHEFTQVQVHEDFESCLNVLAGKRVLR